MRAVSLLMVLALAMFGVEADANAQNVPLQGDGSVRGIVYDSLIMQPMALAKVQLMPSNRTATANLRGEFFFDRVPTGEYTVSHASVLLDSLGLGTIGSTVTVLAGRVTPASITTPSLRSLWTARCTGNNALGRNPSDSGIVWGTVGDARSDTLLDGATVSFQWADLAPRQTRSLTIGSERRAVRSDASGLYFACGVPGSQAIQTVATSPDAASAVVAYALGSRRIRRLDFLVSTDMIVEQSARDSLGRVNTEFAKGTAIVQGIVLDTANKPLAGASVSVASAAGSVRTGADGRFRLEGLPSGTQTLEVKRIGSVPMVPLVQLRPGKTVDVSVQLNTATTLADFAVRGMSPQRAEFEERRLAGIGHVVDASLLDSRSDLLSAMRNIPYLAVSRDASGLGIVINSREPLLYFLDGRPTQLAIVGRMPPETFRAIEVIRNPEQVPAQYYELGKGVVLFWSKSMKW